MESLTVFFETRNLKTFRVTWEIDIEAGSAEEAARDVFEEHFRMATDATWFKVREHNTIDIVEIDVADLEE